MFQVNSPSRLPLAGDVDGGGPRVDAEGFRAIRKLGDPKAARCTRAHIWYAIRARQPAHVTNPFDWT